MKGWYRSAFDRAPPPTQVTLERIIAELVYLYHPVPPPGENIPVFVETFQVEYSVPKEDMIEWKMRLLRNNCYGEPSGM